ncbi:MAG: hypothetical protein SGBAC_003115 [Bacillariaceae sp.]
MMNTRSLCLLLAATLSTSRSSAAEEENSCGLYLATSSTSTANEPKWGIFAGKSYNKQSRIGFGDIAIHTHQMEANALSGEEDEDLLTNIVDFFENFIWVPHPVGGQFELDEGKVVTAIPGGGTLSCYNPKMTNADWNHSAAYFREQWNEEKGVAHPGRGAYSTFYEASIYATDEIDEGMEIFISYGENYVNENSDDSEELSKEDMKKVDMTVNKIVEFFEKHEDELDEESKNEIYQFLIRDVMQAAAGEAKGKIISEVLPDSPDELRAVIASGGVLDYSQPSLVRSTEWLETHGRCLDNISPGPSTIPHAGRGAFASRKIASGAVVTPVPLIQIPDEEVLNMYDVKVEYDENDGTEFHVRNGNEVFGSQLLLNYCYGHPESHMVFFPAGSGASFINHSKKPNAKLQWSKHPNHHSHWYNLEPDELLEEANRYLGLLMEVVATKDIAEGDEIFIDYGDLWQEAWDEHTKDWEKLKKRGVVPKRWPTRAADLNAEFKTKPYKIGAAYPDNVQQKCFLVISKPVDEEPVNSDGDKVRIWTLHKTKETFDSSNLFDCTLIDRQDVDDTYEYTVSWRSVNDPNKQTIVKKVPQKAVIFVDRPHTSDQFSIGAFRHYIQIPDDVFPEGPWRDVGDAEEEE